MYANATVTWLERFVVPFDVCEYCAVRAESHTIRSCFRESERKLTFTTLPYGVYSLVLSYACAVASECCRFYRHVGALFSTLAINLLRLRSAFERYAVPAGEMLSICCGRFSESKPLTVGVLERIIVCYDAQ